MSGLHLRTILQHLSSSTDSKKAATLADAELLRRWVASRDAPAFEVLLWRHGPMILELCQRLLRREQDAEDVFQSVFFALALKGDAISKGEAVGSWLYTVAYRAALQVRGTTKLPQTLDPRLLDRMTAPAGEQVAARELRIALDEEVRRLPEKYRATFILCYLEGLTNEEAAQRLGRPVGTVVSRLARARDWLRRRLTGRGLAPAVVVSLLSAKATRAALPTRLAEEVTRAATLVAAGKAAGAVSPTVAALTQGVLQAMCKSKLTVVALIVLSVVVLGALGTSFSLVQESERRAAWQEASVAYARQFPPTPSGGGSASRDPATPTGFPKPQPHAGPGGPPQPGQAAGPGGPTQPGRPAGPGAGPPVMHQQLRDEVEVLEAQLDVKRAQLKAAQLTYVAAKERLNDLEAIAKTSFADRSAAMKAQMEVSQARSAVAVAQAEVTIREAECREPTVRLAQARRRLAAMGPAAPAGVGRPQMRERLRGLEQKLEALRKDVEAIRKELGEEKPAKP
jgi:RNA polymerase sigma factor (sigma-70 family)